MDSAGTTFRLGDDAADKQYRGLLQFDTSSLPDGAIITSVVLKIKQLSSISGENPFTTHGALQVDVRAPYFGADENLAVNDFQFAAGAANVASFGATPISGTWYSATLNATGRNQISKTAATQFRLRFALDDNDNMKADYFTFYTGNRPPISDRPQLVITYSLP